MTVELIERHDLETNVQPGASTADVPYLIRGTTDPDEVDTLLAAEVPSTYRGLVVQNYRTRHLGGGVWEVLVRYGVRIRRETGEAVVRYSTTGATAHITQSISTAIATKAAGVSGTVPDYKQAIGVNGDQVEGTDITVPTLSFTETRYIVADDVGSEFWSTVSDLTGKVNAASFRGFAAGEVLFLGAEGQQRGVEDWEISFQFAVGKNEDALVVAGSDPFEKKGWEYLWVKYEDAVSETTLVKKPKWIFVERVYDVDDFSLLGIGV